MNSSRIKFLREAFFLSLILFSASVLAQTPLEPKIFNFYNFSPNRKINSVELNLFSKENSHPEFSTLPYNSYCAECFEVIEKRKEDERYFLKEGTEGKEFFIQKSFTPMHFKDAEGRWLTIDPRLKKTSDKTFTAAQQPFPSEINLEQGYTSLTVEDEKFLFNQNVRLFGWSGNEEINEQQSSNEVFFTAGDDGVEQRNFFPGVFRQLVADRGSIEANYILYEKPVLDKKAEWLVIEDEWTLPENYFLKNSGDGIITPDGIWMGDLRVLNEKGEEIIRVKKPLAYDSNFTEGEERKIPQMGYRIESRNGKIVMQVLVSAKWLLSSERAYPITIDPLVNVTQAYINPAYGGSGYAPGSFTNTSCGYTINLVWPGGAQMTNTTFTVIYSNGSGCANSCLLNQGALDVVGPCGISQSSPGVPWSCNVPVFGTCSGITGVPAFNCTDCIPALCTAQNISMTMRLYRNSCAAVSQCDNTCIRLNPNSYTVTLQGITAQTTVSTSSNSVCVGAPVTLTANAQYGVPPYSYLWNPGALTGSPVIVNPLVNTTYTVTVTDACGGTANGLAIVNTLPTATATFTIGNILCIGQQTTITYTGNAIAGATFNWNFGGATIISGSSSGPYVVVWNTAGAYNVSLTVSQGVCTSQPYVQSVAVSPVPTSLFNIASPMCAGAPITITYTGNAPVAATYNWNFGTGTIISGSGQGPFQVQWNTAGTYPVSLQVTAGSCNSPVTNHNAIVITPPTATFTATSPVCEGINSTITYTGNAAAGASYNWNFGGGTVVSGAGQGPFTVNWTTAGSYAITLTVTENGCSTTATPQNVVVNAAPLSSFIITPSPVCVGGSVTITYTGGASAGATYNWSFSGATIVSGSGQGPYTVFWTTTGLKNVSLTVTQNGCTSVPTSYMISVTNGVTSSFSVVTPVCQLMNSTITYTGNAGVGATYTWNFSGGTVASGSGQGPYQVNWATAGNHSVSLQVTQGSCTSIIYYDTVHVNPPPGSNFTIGNACAGQNTLIQYTGNGGPTSTYVWNWGGGTWVSGSGMGPYNIKWSTPGAYNVTLTVTTALGCVSVTTTHVVNVVQPPDPSFTVVSPACAGGGTTVTYTGNASVNAPYNWYFGGGLITSGTGQGPFSITYNNPGNYIITLFVTDFGCPSLPDTEYVVVNPIPIASFSMTPSVCEGVNAVITYTGASPPGATYNWNFNGGIIASGSGQGPYLVHWNTAGTYSVTLVVTENGCISLPVTHTVNVVDAPLADFNTTSPICLSENSNITFTGTASAGAVYTWNFGAATVISGNGAGPYLLSFPSAGTYNITLDILDNGCTSSSTQNVVVYNVPTSDFVVNPLTACMNADVVVAYTGSGLSSDIYNWNFGGGISNGSGQGPYLVQFADTGDYTISLSVSELFCVSDTQYLSVHVYPLPSPNFFASQTTACDQLPTSFTNTSAGAVSYSWNFGDGTSDTATNPTHTFSPGSFDVALTATNQFGCTATLTLNNYILVEATPVADFISNPDAGLELALAENNFVFENLSQNGTSFNWTFGDGDSSGIMHPSHIYVDTGEYMVTLIAFNDVGCSDTVMKGPYLIVPAALIFIPNAFTPNGDGTNEVFKIYGRTISETTLEVFDRWGELVYSGDGFKEGWDGTFNGQPVNTGVFVYHAVITKNSGLNVILQGDLTLIR